MKTESTKSSITTGLSCWAWVLVVSAVVLRLINIDVSLWLDEILLHKRASQPFNEVLGSSQYPLANLLAWLTLKLGDTEFTLRIPNLLAGLLAIYALYSFCKKHFSIETGLIGATLLVFNPYHIEYSQDARYYGLMSLFTVLVLSAATAYLIRPSVLLGIALWLSIVAGIANQLVFIPLAFAITFGMVAYTIFAPISKKHKLLQILSIGFIFATTFAPLYFTNENYLASHPLKRNIGHFFEDKEKRTAQVLQISEYVSYFWDNNSGFLRRTSPVFKFAIYASALVGLLCVYKKHKQIFFIFISALVVAPLPSFIIPTSNGYLSRYFIGQMCVAIILSSVGISCVTHRMLSLSFFSRRVVFHAGTVALILALCTPYYRGLKHYYTWQSHDLGWKVIANGITPYMSQEDALIYIYSDGNPNAWKYVMHEPLEFYLSKTNLPGKISNVPKNLSGFHVNEVNNSTFSKLLKNHAHTNIWVLGNSSIDRTLPNKSGQHFDVVAETNRLKLLVLGRPTINLVSNGDFDDKSSIKLTDNEKQKVAVGKTSDHAGGNYLILERNLPGNSVISLDFTEFDPAANHLTSQSQYVLSLWTNYKNLRPNKWPASTARLGIGGIDPDGKSVFKTIKWWAGSSNGWQRNAFLIDTTEYPDLVGLTNMKIYLGIYGGTGTFMSDSVQLEKGRKTSPFTATKRPSHDKLVSSPDL